MKILYLLFSIVALHLSVSKSAVAKWYTVEGSAPTSNISRESAREIAIENAMKKVFLVAGANISTTQQVMNGLLIQDEVSIRASGSVNSVEIIDELYHDDMVTVTVRADVFSKEGACYKQRFKKSILLTKSYIIHREQANIGEIYRLDRALSKKLQEKMLVHDLQFSSRVIHKEPTPFSRLNSSARASEIKELAMTLSRISHSQYILFSEINDLSLDHKRENNWSVWQGPLYQRAFGVTYYLYNGINGELVWQQNYKEHALWDFPKRDIIDVNGMAFWQSDYGIMVSSVLNSVKNDLDNAVVCSKSEAIVMKVTNQEVILNLGRVHGVRLGDEFTLVYSKNYYDDNGEHFSSKHISDYKVRVTKVTENTAIARSDEHTGNIQVNDLAIRY
jgi:hypothetical protein